MRQALGRGALGKPRGSGWRGRWEGGIGMGNTCKPMAISFQCMTKFTTNKKIKKERKKKVKSNECREAERPELVFNSLTVINKAKLGKKNFSALPHS